MRKFYFVLGLIGLGAMSSGAHAAPILNIVDAVGDPSSTSITAGDTFSVLVRLNSDVPFTGVTFFLETSGAGSGKFSITGRTASVTSPLADETTANGTVLNAISALLDPQNNSDLGYSAADPGTDIVAGNYDIASVTLQSNVSLTPGTYTIKASSNAVLTNANFDETPVGSSTYTVQVVPEPGSLGLIMAGAGLLLRRRRH